MHAFSPDFYLSPIAVPKTMQRCPSWQITIYFYAARDYGFLSISCLFQIYGISGVDKITIIDKTLLSYRPFNAPD
jgi:hypothetical protein